MRVDFLKMKILQLNKFTVGGQESGFEIPHLTYPEPLGLINEESDSNSILCFNWNSFPE